MGKFMKVIFTPQFKLWLKNYPKADQIKIGLFVEHVKQFGLDNLQGRNKSSDNVPTDDPNWLQKVKYTQAYRLWHYHIGIPDYAGEFGDMTSEYILHYQRFDDEIVIVDMSAHPPFELPSIDRLI